jgi:hypothetical protein
MVNNQATAEFNDYLTQMMTSLSLYSAWNEDQRKVVPKIFFWASKKLELLVQMA